MHFKPGQQKGPSSEKQREKGIPSEPAAGDADLRGRGDRYRAFLEFLPDPVFVFNLDSTVSYLNPAFERVFGWTLKELQGKRIPFVPDHLRQQTREGIQRLFKEKVIHGFETQRLTRDGRILDVIVDGSVFYDENGQPAGQVVTFTDVTRQKRMDRSNQAMFRIAKALYQFRGLDERLDFITREVQDLMAVEGALVILIDEEKQEFFFRAAAYDDSEAEKKYRETRYPLDKGVAGQVFRTGKPMIVPDYYNSPFAFENVDKRTGSKTRNMLQVPMWTEHRMIGTLCMVNKREGQFDRTDVDLLSTIASIVALPIVNARINEELEQSYEEVKSLNRAKDRVIHHLSHELKTPVSVLDASISLLSKKLCDTEKGGAARILDRARRNLHRILEMQYEIEDILREKDYTSYRLLTTMLDACVDELEVLVADELGREDMMQRIRARIENLFGPKEAVSEEIRLDLFVEEKVRDLRSAFTHRRCNLITQISTVPPIRIPGDVLAKIIEGLIRNAVENTPDGSRIVVTVSDEKDCPALIVSDFGVGITAESQYLIFENYFTSYDTMQYTSREPFDFGAGGKGFDLLRMKIFSERYHFTIKMKSRRCRFIPRSEDRCPGDIELCEHCRSDLDCIGSGGTTVQVSFPTAERMDSGSREGHVGVE